MRTRLAALFRKELRQIVRSRRTVGAAATVPALMLIFVAGADIIAVKYGFHGKPIYLLTTSHPLTGTTMLRHFSLPVLITISALVTPSIVMGDVVLGERYQRTLELLVALPVSAADVILAKVLAVLTFAICVAVPLFVVNTVLVDVTGYGSPAQTLALAELMLAAIAYSIASALVIAVAAGEPRAANIVSGLLLGPIVPMEGLILAAVSGLAGVTISTIALVCLAAICLFWSMRLLSFERLFGT